MPTILDLHTHTVIASPDSELTPSKLVQVARRAGLNGACITEHNRSWDLREAEVATKEHNFSFIRGMEINTDLGHILVFGLNQYVSGIHIAKDLRKTVKAAGGIMIAAHPFRNLFHSERQWGGSNGKPPILAIEESARLPIFDLVDEVEVLNGGTGELENFYALQVAKHLGFRGTAGSDAHSVHGLGHYATAFEKYITTTEELIVELKAGRFYAAKILLDSPQKDVVSYSDGVVNADLDLRLRVAMATD